jgi:hypothetical protein
LQADISFQQDIAPYGTLGYEHFWTKIFQDDGLVGWANFIASFLLCYEPPGFFSKAKGLRVVALNELCMVITGAVFSVIPQMLGNILVGNILPL